MKKRLLFLVTMLVASALGFNSWAQPIAVTDVTNVYLSNAGFENCTASTSNVAATGSANSVNYADAEWTSNGGAAWSSSAVVAYGGTGQVNGVSAPSSDNVGNSGNTLGVSVGWGGKVYYQSSSFTLPAGSYTLRVYGYNNLNNVTQFKSLFGFVSTSGTSVMSTKTSFTYGTWESDEIELTITESTEGKIQVGGQASDNGGSGANAKVFFDNVTILYHDPALAPKLVELKGVVKKAKALNTVLEDSDLAQLITTVEGTTYTTIADMQADIDAIKAYYENLETISLVNGNFDTDVNIALDGTNSASIIDPATSEKPYIYPVTGWTQNFKFSSTASQGNTAVYGATISGTYGNNGTNPPTADMFGNSDGGTLHLSAGWNDQARYKQELTNLPPGKYIIYYEANNQNSSNNNITANYFGLGDLEDGNLKGSSNTFVYSDLKQYPYNEWVASATGFSLIAPEEAATMNVGLTSTTGQSVNGAKLWIDNVTLYYLGWDATEAKETLQNLVDTADELLTKQMNQDVKPQLTIAKANAETVIDSSTDYDEIANAQLALTTAVNNAQESVEEYEKIKEYMDLLGTADQRGDITEVELSASDAFAKYSDGVVDGTADPTTGTYTSFNEFLPLYKSFVTDYWNENKTAGANLTAFVLNQGFEMGEISSTGIDFWTVTKHNGGNYIATDNGNRVANLWANYDTTEKLSQTIEGLPNGTYQLKAYVRSCNPDITLSVNGKETTSSNVENNDWPNYAEVVAVGPVTNGKLDIAVIASYANGYSYFRADNISLTFISEDITAEAANYTLATGQMSATAKQAMVNAEDIFQNSSTVDNYNALITAIDAANASVAVYEDINIYLTALTLDNQRGDIALNDMQEMSFYTKYSDGQVNGVADMTTGTYTSLNEVISEYKSNVADYWSNASDGDNLTAFIINQGFQFGNATGWTGGGTVDGDGTNYTMEKYNTNFNFYQTLNGLPEGTYTLTAQAFYRPGANNNQSTEQNTMLYAGEATAPVTLIAAGGKAVADSDNGFTTANTNNGSENTVYVPNSMSSAAKAFTSGAYSQSMTFIVSNNSVTVGAKKTTTISSDWSIFDNFQLIYNGTELPADSISALNELATIDLNQPMNNAEKETYIAALAEWQKEQSATNYQTLKDIIPVVRASINAYATAANDLEDVLNFVNTTNVYTFDAYNTFFTAYNKSKTMYENGTLSDNAAATLKTLFFGNGTYHQRAVPVVPFLGSAWDDAGDYTWEDYWINTWSNEGGSDGSNMTTPFMEYWVNNNSTLQTNTLEATTKATVGGEYVVTALVRVRTTDAEEPEGVTMQIVGDYDDNGTTAYHTNVASPTWTQCGEGYENFWYASFEVTGYADAIDTDNDGYGDLHIQFVIDGENTNASWLAFKNVRATFNGTMSMTNINSLKNQMEAAVAESKAHTLGFDWKGDDFGTQTEEYAPYNNARQLKATEYCENYLKALYALDEKLDNNEITEAEYIAQIPTYLLMKQACDGLIDANTSWTANTNEVNAFCWKSNYTTDQVEVISFYEDNGQLSTFNTIYPEGWDLAGRSDAYATRIMKYGVNNWDKGVKQAISDQTALLTKYDTFYGDETGYTMPLKAGVEYSLTFIYADCGDGGKKATANLYLYEKDTQEEVTLTPESITPAESLGENNPDHWYYYRTTFTPENDGNYVFKIEKDRQLRRSQGFSGWLTEQLQIVFGELRLVRAPREIDTYTLDGEDSENDYSPVNDVVARYAYVNRNFNANGTDGTWNTLVIPFSLDAQETETYFGVDEVAYYTGTTFENDVYTLQFEMRNGGIKANQPVMLFYNEETLKNLSNNEESDDFVKFVNVVVEKPVNTYTVDGVDYPAITGDQYFAFVGTYNRTTVPEHSVYINATNNWKRSKGSAGLKPSRAYFFDLTGGEASAKLMGFNVDQVPTGIIAVEEDGEMRVTSGNIYTIDGRLVREHATSLEGLQPGIYVVDGKKYIVR